MRPLPQEGSSVTACGLFARHRRGCTQACSLTGKPQEELLSPFYRHGSRGPRVVLCVEVAGSQGRLSDSKAKPEKWADPRADCPRACPRAALPQPGPGLASPHHGRAHSRPAPAPPGLSAELGGLGIGQPCPRASRGISGPGGPAPSALGPQGSPGGCRKLPSVVLPHLPHHLSLLINTGCK